MDRNFTHYFDKCKQCKQGKPCLPLLIGQDSVDIAQLASIYELNSDRIKENLIDALSLIADEIAWSDIAYELEVIDCLVCNGCKHDKCNDSALCTSCKRNKLNEGVKGYDRKCRLKECINPTRKYRDNPREEVIYPCPSSSEDSESECVLISTSSTSSAELETSLEK